jgi:hypothetical protein
MSGDETDWTYMEEKILRVRIEAGTGRQHSAGVLEGILLTK